VLTGKVTFPHVEPMPQWNSWSSFAGSILPIHHLHQILHLMMSTSLDFWWSTSKENASDMMTKW
jgi:hypothetical protein